MAISFNKNSLKAIEEPYLLATGISCYVDEKGNRYLHELWVKDIIEHLRYIKKLTLIGPRTDGAPPVDYVNVSSAPDFVNVIYVDLVAVTGTLDALLKLPKIVRTFWRAVQSNFFIHTAVAGWPIPYGWILTPMAIILNKRLIILVESAFWRLTPNVENGFKARTRAAISEYLGSWCVNKADLALFTQEEYKNSLLTNGKSLGYVDPASWIDDVNIVTNIEANISWDLKREMAKDGLNIVYVGKLNSKKGVEILLDALNICESRSVRVNLDILGEGELSARCNDFTKIPRKSVNARMLGTVPYDANFYKLLRSYHLIVVPAISDEQPRVIYDAFSQAIPVFASDTSGNRACVNSYVNGFLFESNSSLELSNSLVWASENPEKLSIMGIEAIAEATTKTHTAMHHRRLALISALTK